ncbi:HAD family hydrolase [Sporosalibacterium faouarense]|uniref:HAD family hydrolase n=1 Tax=Sporosalibacterium faouarense TaxID=516123 RepID=UPI00141D204C|nr:HAD family hydrolase [Sporosalibacterium faouarense]MTI47027.1 Cof-type HAD-IIB family hydrolase [Bacillota bacterium]
MNYKLIAIDLDGTLLNDEKKIPKLNIEILQELYKKGLEIVIATGRRYWSAKDLIQELKLDLVVLGNNGNIVRETKDDTLIVTKYMDMNDFYNLVKEGRKVGLFPILHVDHYHDGYDMLIELDPEHSKYSSYMSKNLKRYKRVNDFLDYKDANVLVACFMGDVEELKSFEKHLKKSYPNRYNSHIMSQLTMPGGLLEIMNPKGSKWLTLKDYAVGKGIKSEEIIAIGDDNNDIEMIRRAGLGIGMKNGSDKVKKVADIITKKTNNEGGVGEILREVLNNLII